MNISINKDLSVSCFRKDTRNGFRHIARLFYKGENVGAASISYINRTWESYEFKTVLQKLAADNEARPMQQQEFIRFMKTYNGYSPLKPIAAVAMLGDIFGSNQKEANDWKTRMLKAGLGESGLVIPEDWETLSENEKERRLNGAIEAIR